MNVCATGFIGYAEFGALLSELKEKLNTLDSGLLKMLSKMTRKFVRLINDDHKIHHIRKLKQFYEYFSDIEEFNQDILNHIQDESLTNPQVNQHKNLKEAKKNKNKN